MRDERIGMNPAISSGSQGFHLAFRGMVGLFLVYAALFIYRTSFVVAGERYFSLFDDAMISMRYARNWPTGTGWCGIPALARSRVTPTPRGCSA